MVEMEHKDGATISAHPSKVESLKNMGWTVCGEKKPAKKVKPVIEEPKDSEEE